MFNKKIIAILTTSSNYQRTININSLLYREILKEFKELYIIDLKNLIFFKKKKINKKTLFKINKKTLFKIKGIKIFKPNNSLELINFFKEKKLIAFHCLGKGLPNFKIYYILNKINLTQILLLNIGLLNNAVEINKDNVNFTRLYFFYNKLFTRYIFKFLTIINIFPKIDYYFDSSKPTIKNINSSFIRKIEKVFPKIKISERQ